MSSVSEQVMSPSALVRGGVSVDGSHLGLLVTLFSDCVCGGLTRSFETCDRCPDAFM